MMDLPVPVHRGPPLVARFKIDLALDVDGYAKLVPEAECRQLVAELEAGLRPSGPETALKQIRVLVGAYPERKVGDDDVYARAIASVLAEVPADIGVQTVDHVTRHLRFFPTRADVADVAGQLVRERRRLLSKAKAHLAEHERRKAAGAPSGGYADLTPEQKAEHDRMMANLRARFRSARDEVGPA